MTKTLLCGVAALAFTLIAPNAFAQDADLDVKAKVQAEQMMDAAEDAADEAMDAAEDAADSMEEAADDMMDEAADDMDDAVEMDADVDVTVGANVGCPSGTEAQGDGTCMVTGDWSPED